MQHFSEHEIQPDLIPAETWHGQRPEHATDSYQSDPGSNDGENAVEFVRTCHP